MIENRAAQMSLFELLARHWSLDSEIVQVEFNHDETAVLFRLMSGKLALVSTIDTESPKNRTRVAVDTGQTTIKQRTKPIAAAVFTSVKAHAEFAVMQFGPKGFLAVDKNGVPNQISAQGQSVATYGFNDASMSALCSTHNGDTLAIARNSGITLIDTNEMQELAEISIDRPISRMSFSDSGNSLAVWGVDCLTSIDIKNRNNPPRQIQGINNVTQLNWDQSESLVACASSSHSFYIVDTLAGSFHQVKNYPGPVNNAIFSEKGEALVTSGAYRLTGWSINDLPQNNNPGTPLITGKPGLIVIDAIAAHPKRSLVAAGYANGLITISNIGSPQEMMVHQESGTQINQLAWSKSGEHLAIGFKSGKAAIVSFPDQLFK